jgi:hypothetical protein
VLGWVSKEIQHLNLKSVLEFCTSGYFVAYLCKHQFSVGLSVSFFVLVIENEIRVSFGFVCLFDHQEMKLAYLNLIGRFSK